MWRHGDMRTWKRFSPSTFVLPFSHLTYFHIPWLSLFSGFPLFSLSLLLLFDPLSIVIRLFLCVTILSFIYYTLSLSSLSCTLCRSLTFFARLNLFHPQPARARPRPPLARTGSCSTRTLSTCWTSGAALRRKSRRLPHTTRPLQRHPQRPPQPLLLELALR